MLAALAGKKTSDPEGHASVVPPLDDIERRGIRHLFYFQVDNPLVDICAPEFIGYHLLAGSEMTPQVICKDDPLEKVGAVVEVDGRQRVIEYSDLPDELAYRRNADGSLAIWAGSIAVHIIETALLRRLASTAEGLPFHYAHKKVKHIDAAGKRIEPQQPNAIKFERFIFDLLPFSANPMVVEVARREGFAPLKNAPGASADTAEMVEAMMIAQHVRWLKQAGADVAEGVPVEISPLFALDAEELSQKIPPGMKITEPTFLQG
jgi:UDP-N-acetylglucosamine/UDP-N-acetylgalactosamine diphosphorylase